MAYSALAVANEFLELAKKDGKQLTQMQLQKLVYFAYGWYLVITGERLIDERVEAWQWGPVVPSVYSAFKRFGSDPIKEPASESTFRKSKSGGFRVGFQPYSMESDDPGADLIAKQIVEKVWQIYGKFKASQLSNMTHEPNSPWSRTPGKEIRGTDIDDKLIMAYFRQLATARDNEQQPAHTGP